MVLQCFWRMLWSLSARLTQLNHIMWRCRLRFISAAASAPAGGARRCMLVSSSQYTIVRRMKSCGVTLSRGCTYLSNSLLSSKESISSKYRSVSRSCSNVLCRNCLISGWFLMKDLWRRRKGKHQLCRTTKRRSSVNVHWELRGSNHHLHIIHGERRWIIAGAQKVNYNEFIEWLNLTWIWMFCWEVWQPQNIKKLQNEY